MLFKDRSEVNKLREDYIKSLKSELKSLSSKDELCTHPELLFYSKNKRLRRFSDKGRSIDVTEDSLQEYLAKEHYVITFGVDIFEIYKAIVDYLYGLAHCCIYGKEYLMYLCKLKSLNMYPDEGTIFDNPDDYFATINDVLCFIKPTGNHNYPVQYIPITAKKFKKSKILEFDTVFTKVATQLPNHPVDIINIKTDTPQKKQATSIVELLDSLSECEIRTIIGTDIKS